MKLIYRGAEADLLLGEWAGEKAIHKVRKPLPYRLEALDRAIRSHRTLHEANMIHSARSAGVRTPYLYFVNPTSALIVMEYIEGERMKTVLELAPDDIVISLCRRFGEDVAAMHTAGIMHGDITTSNVIVRDSELVFIDFGLSLHSAKLEDHAVDLRLIKETLNGAHSRIASVAFGALLDGYKVKVGEARLDATKRKLSEIEGRGRYAKVE
ncbi:MAG: KEOPS complex kinase/ATPase Bud32 [Thaumarchaeota archaeon]|nr:KEOPS complex kinase/ATPase Bud32 [Nitrososphaerota archaeon]